MAAPARSTDDAPTTPIARADLQRAARGRRGLVIGTAVAATVALLVAAGIALGAAGRPADPTPTAAPAATMSPAASSAPAAPGEVPPGGRLFGFTSSPRGAAAVADGKVVAVLAEVSTTMTSSIQLTTYDQRTGAQLAQAGPGLPELLVCGVDVVRRPDGTSVVLTRYDTETPATGVQLGTRVAHLGARDGRTLRPLWDVPLHSGDSNDFTVGSNDCGGNNGAAFKPTLDGRFVLTRTFDVPQVVDLTTGAARPVPYAVNVVGKNVVIGVPRVDAGAEPPKPTLPSPGLDDTVRLVRAADLGAESTISDADVAHAVAKVDNDGSGTLTAYHQTGNQETGLVDETVSSDGRTLIHRTFDTVEVVDLPSGRTRTSISTPQTPSGDSTSASEDPIVVVPGETPDRDVLVLSAPVETPGSSSPTGRVYSGYSLDGRRLWALPVGGVDGVCAVDRETLLLDATGLVSLDPQTGRQLTVEPQARCPRLTHGLRVDEEGSSAVSTSADTVVSVLRR